MLFENIFVSLLFKVLLLIFTRRGFFYNHFYITFGLPFLGRRVNKHVIWSNRCGRFRIKQSIQNDIQLKSTLLLDKLTQRNDPRKIYYKECTLSRFYVPFYILGLQNHCVFKIFLLWLFRHFVTLSYCSHVIIPLVI